MTEISEHNCSDIRTSNFYKEVHGTHFGKALAKVVEPSEIVRTKIGELLDSNPHTDPTEPMRLSIYCTSSKLDTRPPILTNTILFYEDRLSMPIGDLDTLVQIAISDFIDNSDPEDRQRLYLLAINSLGASQLDVVENRTQSTESLFIHKVILCAMLCALFDDPLDVAMVITKDPNVANYYSLVACWVHKTRTGTVIPFSSP